MGSLRGPVIFPVRAKEAGVYNVLLNGPFSKSRILRSELWGRRAFFRQTADVDLTRRLVARRCKGPRCSFSSSSNGNGSMAESFNEHDEDYVNSSVVEAGMLMPPLIFLGESVGNS